MVSETDVSQKVGMTDSDPTDSNDHVPFAVGVLPPAADHPEVLRFQRLHGIPGPARFVDHLAGPYDPDWCHVSAKHKASTEGGRRVHGWSLWLFGEVVVGDHHSVWQTPDGELVDVTPPKFDEDKVLFLRDDSATIEEEGGVVYLLTNRTSVPGAEFMWAGKPSEYSHYSVRLTDPGLSRYCERFGLPTTAILTDADG